MEHTEIIPNRWNIFGFKDVVRHYELLWMFIWRDIKIRYKQTLLGIMWVVFQPLVTMAIITLFFGLIIKIPSAGLPYPIFFLSAYIAWVLFYDGIIRSYTSVMTNSTIITKVYFPRLILPLSGVIAPLVDFSIAFVVLVVLIKIYGLSIPASVVAVPLFMGWALLLSLGIGSFFSALHVKYRDVQYALPFMTMVFMYTSPIFYPASMIPEQYHWLYYLSPLAWIIDGMRYVLFDIPLSTQSPLPAILITVVVLIVGVLFFEYFENRFADWI